MTSAPPRDEGPSGRASGGRAPTVVVLLSGVVLLLAAAWVVGPRPAPFTVSWVEPELPADLDAWVAGREGAVADLRPGDGRALVWADSTLRVRTPVSLVYLHGFSADRHEIAPVVTELAMELGANVYYARLTGHGRDGPAMADATVEAWLADASEALAVGGLMGDRVVLIGTSTGGTLATWLAARPEAADRLAAVVLISPNFQPADRSSRVLLGPWGGVLARLMIGEERCWDPLNEAQARHWTTCYPTSVLGTMMSLVEYVRTMDLSGVTVPVLTLQSPQDRVVDPAETMRRMSDLSTDVRLVDYLGSTDPSQHVLAGDIVSPESSAEVRGLMRAFLREVLDLDGPTNPTLP